MRLEGNDVYLGAQMTQLILLILQHIPVSRETILLSSVLLSNGDGPALQLWLLFYGSTLACGFLL